MSKKKDEWSVVHDFDPRKAGFVFDPSVSCVGLIDTLLNAFDHHSPKPGHIHEFVEAICFDGIHYWQLREELVRRGKTFEASALECGTYRGFRVHIMGIDGIGLALRTTMAPIIIRQQIALLREESEAMREVHEIVNGPLPDKEEMH